MLENHSIPYSIQNLVQNLNSKCIYSKSSPKYSFKIQPKIFISKFTQPPTYFMKQGYEFLQTYKILGPANVFRADQTSMVELSARELDMPNLFHSKIWQTILVYRPLDPSARHSRIKWGAFGQTLGCLLLLTPAVTGNTRHNTILTPAVQQNLVTHVSHGPLDVQIFTGIFCPIVFICLPARYGGSSRPYKFSHCEMANWGLPKHSKHVSNTQMGQFGD